MCCDASPVQPKATFHRSQGGVSEEKIGTVFQSVFGRYGMKSPVARPSLRCLRNFFAVELTEGIHNNHPLAEVERKSKCRGLSVGISGARQQQGAIAKRPNEDVLRR